MFSPSCLRAPLGVLAILGMAAPATASTSVAAVNSSLLDAIRASAATTPPPRASRAIAMVGISMYDAVNAASGMVYTPYQTGMTAMAGLNRDAVAYAAGYTMMINLFPTLSGSLTVQMNSHLDSLNLAAPARSAALGFGSSVANGFYASRLSDGAAGAQTPYVYGSGPGAFQNVGAPGAQPLLPGWGNVATFGVSSAADYRLAPPPPVGSAEFIADYNQVRALGCATCGTPEMKTIARFWADGGGTLTPPGHWLEIATGLADGLSTMQAARLTAMVGASVADAGITAWDTKYAYNVWRPVTAINNCTMATCGVEGEPGWTPFLGTPNFPSYTSGHSTFSGAGAAAIGRFFGTDAVPICVAADPLAGVAGTRCFASLSAAAEEAGLSRIYGGIHYEFDNTRAVLNGRKIGSYIGANFFGLAGAVPEPGSWIMLIAGFGLVGVAARRREGAAA